MVPTDIVVAVQQVQAAYSYHYDRRDYESLRGVFSEDAVLDVDPAVDVPGYPLPARGRDGVIDALNSRGDYFDIVRRRHVATTQFVHVDEDGTVRCTAYMIVIHTPEGGSPEIVQVGEYDDEMVQCPDGEWRIAARVVRKDRRGPVIDSMAR